jgi:hypothetical protein
MMVDVGKTTRKGGGKEEDEGGRGGQRKTKGEGREKRVEMTRNLASNRKSLD